MTFQKLDEAFIDYDAYAWGRLDQLYRGPKPDLSEPYIACLGGAQTFGRYADSPFPALLQQELGMTVANFGASGVGPGFYLRDSMVMEAASNAELCVVQVMGARTLSNRLFKVKTDRRPQVETVSKALEKLFPHVDFAAFTYAHNMLNEIAGEDPASFAEVRAEMKTAWIARTTRLLEAIQTKRILFWFSERTPDAESAPTDETPALKYPQFVDREMIDAVAPLVDEVVQCVSSAGMPQSLLRDGDAVLQSPFGAPVNENRYYPTPQMHEEAAAALSDPIRALLAAADATATSRDRSFTV